MTANAPIHGFMYERPIVSLRHLGKVYQPTPPLMRFLVRTPIKHEIVALDSVDLDVYAGTICAIVGPNGAGKTTMFRVLTGLTTPSSGKAIVNGLSAHHQSSLVRRVIGWMPAEDRSLFLRLSCKENLQFHGRLHGLSGQVLERRIDETLEMVGLGHMTNASVIALSAGMRARLQLARALLHRPRVLILDEPTGAVDPVGAHQLLSVIISLVKEQRLAALVSSHRLEEIEALHSQVVLLDRGQVRYHGDLDELRRRWDRQSWHITFRNPVAAEAAQMVLPAERFEPTLEQNVLTCRPLHDVTMGELLTLLGRMLEEVEHISEGAVPLRDLLARMYSQPGRVGSEVTS